MANIKEKIAKLLRLAKSDNENEAKDALLKARKLMAENKLMEADCIDSDKLEVKRIFTGIEITKATSSWAAMLAPVIAENHCCTSLLHHMYNRKKYEISFVGFENDVDLCTLVYKYAVDCVNSKIKEMRKEYKDVYTAKKIRAICNSYGAGFVEGVARAYKAQNEESDWGLVLVTPEEVAEFTEEACTGHTSFADKEPDSLEAHASRAKGVSDGRAFDPKRRIISA